MSFISFYLEISLAWKSSSLGNSTHPAKNKKKIDTLLALRISSPGKQEEGDNQMTLAGFMPISREQQAK